MSNLRQMGLAAHLYADDHDGNFPPDFLAMKGQLPGPIVLFCPADSKNGGRAGLTWDDFDPSRSSYECVTRSLTASTPALEKKALFRCKIHGHELMGDGHVEQKKSGMR
jgi:hypothetical protein